MKTSTKRALSILFSVFFLICAVIVFTNLIKPELEEIGRLRGEVMSKNQNYLVQKNAITQVAEIISQLKSANDLQKTLSFAMPVKANVTEILNQWYAISRNSEASVRALDIKVGSLVSKPPHPLLKGRGTISVSLDVVGTYEALKQFLNSLETNSRVVNVVSFDLSPVMGMVSSSGTLYSLKMEVETYYQVD